jgi:hypothetical protein
MIVEEPILPVNANKRIKMAIKFLLPKILALIRGKQMIKLEFIWINIENVRV